MHVETDPVLVSVIVPTYRDAHLLGACLEALAKQKTQVSFEVVVVNSDGDQHIDLPVWPPVRAIQSNERLLPGNARNVGARASRAVYVAFTDADCEPDETWIDALAQALDSGLNLVGGVVKDLHPFHPVASADNWLQFADYPRGRPWGKTDHLPGCNMAVNRDVFERVGGFPEDTSSGEDVMLAERISRLDPDRAAFDPRLAVGHEGRRTLRAMWIHQRTFGFHRARLGLRMEKSARRRLRSPLYCVYFCVRRFGYLAYRTALWDMPNLPRFLLFSPWIMIGLVAYGVGLHRGANELD